MATEPVGLSSNLPNQRVMPASFEGNDVAVWRSASGRLSAWVNQCPHRGMRLSHGFVRGESLACLYHGWQYDAAGSCNFIPAHPELTPPAIVKTQPYSIFEQSGILWVSDDEHPELPEGLAALGDKTVEVRSIAINCSSETLHTGLTKARIKIDKELELYAEATEAVFSFHAADSDQSVYLFSQKISSHKQFCHILASGLRGSEELIAVSNWIESLRRKLEFEHHAN